PITIETSRDGVAMAVSQWEARNHNTGDRLVSYDAAAACISVSGISQQQRSAPDPYTVRVSRAAETVQGAENSGHRRLLQLCAGRQPRPGRARAENAEGPRGAKRGRAVSSGAQQIPKGRRVGALLRRSARARPIAHGMERQSALRESPVRGDVGRRPW